jgi:hypothetical protein
VQQLRGAEWNGRNTRAKVKRNQLKVKQPSERDFNDATCAAANFLPPPEMSPLDPEKRNVFFFIPGESQVDHDLLGLHSASSSSGLLLLF